VSRVLRPLSHCILSLPLSIDSTLRIHNRGFRFTLHGLYNTVIKEGQGNDEIHKNVDYNYFHYARTLRALDSDYASSKEYFKIKMTVRFHPTSLQDAEASIRATVVVGNKGDQTLDPLMRRTLRHLDTMARVIS
jgi:hypothetical protein